MGRMSSVLKPVADRYNQKTQAERYQFRRLLRSLVKWYGYVSQVARMFDEELHKENVFCAYLLKLLPPDEVSPLDLEGKLQLEYYKLQKTFAGAIELEHAKGVYEPVTQKGALGHDPKEPLDEIILKINEKFKGEFTNADRYCLPPCMTVCWPTRSWQSWRAAPTRRSLPRASSPKPLTPPHRTVISKRRTPSLPCLRIPASTRLLCRHWQSGCMGNSARSKTVFLFVCLKQPASTGCSSRVWMFPTSILQRNGVCIDRHIACRCYETSQHAFQNLKIILQSRPSVFKFNLKRAVIFLHKKFSSLQPQQDGTGAFIIRPCQVPHLRCWNVQQQMHQTKERWHTL